MDVLVVAAAAFALSFVNGANDVSKGIATLVGSGISDCRRAISWGALCTAAGCLLGGFVASAMIATFGQGMLAPGTAPTLAAAVATLCGAAAWVLLATSTGLPVSTTHAIVGAVCGVAAVAHGPGAVQWAALAGKVALPLLVSPVAAFVLTRLLLRTSLARQAPCICADLAPSRAAIDRRGLALASGLAPRITTGTVEECAVHRPVALRLTLDHLHWLTSGATSLARGMNDAPKIVALFLAALAIAGRAPSPGVLFAAATVAMVAGSLAAGKRVTKVLAEKVTPMDHREGLFANAVTSALVIVGAVWGLPMSTTHVSSG